ncbi:MAG TPA: (d)CMP kinase [Candidatus Limnocylindria bacterium]|nr:(d)CMP kinase [Candidatus Limnocylindria bacterium]
MVRIQKALADAGVASRRAAEQLVAAGRVTVNGRPAEVGQQVDPDVDELSLDGRPVGGPPAAVYLMLSKPAGVTSTVADRHAATTVVELVPEELRRRARRLYPVGRLDRDSEGLLLLTNDGEWAQRVLHPRHEVEREYAVGLEEALDADQLEALELGIELEEGLARLAEPLRRMTRGEVRRLEGVLEPASGPDPVWYRAVLRQGWKRQLRRMFGAVGAPVARLVRVRLGPLELGALRPGGLRELEEDEVAALAGQSPSILAAMDDDPAGETPSEATGGSALVVTLDGPGGSGKSSVGAAAAERLGYRFCDTGVLYRGLTWLALERGVDPADAAALVRVSSEIELLPDAAQGYVRLLAGGREVTDLLHTAAVDSRVSHVSRHAEVRAALLPVQRALAGAGRLIMAGRDIGTVVLPDADLKLYLHVSLEERARRRAGERGASADAAALARIEAELRHRDGVDSTRAVAPLRVPPGALVIETDGNTLEQTVEAVVGAVRRAEAERVAVGDS